MSRTKIDKRFAERNAMFSRRQAFRESSSVQWLTLNLPLVWQAIVDESNKRFPIEHKWANRKTKIDYSFLRKVKARP